MAAGTTVSMVRKLSGMLRLDPQLRLASMSRESRSRGSAIQSLLKRENWRYWL
jgi:hypothetical protein